MYYTFISSTFFVLRKFEKQKHKQKKEERQMADLIYCILFIFLAAVTPTHERTALNWNFLSVSFVFVAC